MFVFWNGELNILKSRGVFDNNLFFLKTQKAIRQQKRIAFCVLFQYELFFYFFPFINYSAYLDR